MHLKRILVLGVLFSLGNLEAQQAESRRTFAVRVEVAPIIDGRLDDTVWEKAVLISDFVQHEPLEGEPATERTEVRVLYDSKNLYVGVWCYDGEASGILVTESQRDSDLTNTDAFWMVLDTYLDRRTAFVFGTNPMGIEVDGQVNNDGSGGNFNKDWDASWRVHTHINEDGWMAEFEIPLSTLRFKSSESQVWGANFARNIRRKNEQDYWSRVPRQWNLYRVSLAGELHGLELEAPTNFKLTPYVVGRMEQDFQDSPDGEARYSGDLGVDVKYGVATNLALDLTYNTDFAQVEVDEQQVNLTRFNLFFPEKRPFFLENAGFFSIGTPQQVELFFSRRIGLSQSGEIVPIVGGARLSGKISRWNLGLLNMQTEEVGDCSAGVLDTGSECVAPPTNFTVAVLSRQFGTHSTLGGLFINKDSTGSGLAKDDYNRTFALEGRLGFGDSFQASAYAAKTATFHEGEPPFDGNDRVYRAHARYKRPELAVQLGYTKVGEDFNPEVGFVSREGYEGLNGGINTFFRVPSVKWLRELRPHLTWRVFYDLDGFKEDETIHMDTHVEWENGTFFSPAMDIIHQGLTETFEIFPGVVTPPGSYRHLVFAWRFNSNLSAPFSVEARLDAGGFYNGNLRGYSTTLNWRYGAQLTTSLEYTRNQVRLPLEVSNGELLGGNFDTNLAKARVNYSFTPRIFVQSLMQYSDASDIWSINLRFGWLNTAGTGLFVVYKETSDLENIDFGLRTGLPAGSPLSRALFIKFTREFNPFQ